MANHELLNNISHKDLRVIADRSLDLGDNTPTVLAFPNEFRQLQSEFPICFVKIPTQDNSIVPQSSDLKMMKTYFLSMVIGGRNMSH